MFHLQDINKSWTLFLDRDGVINEEKKDDYIYHKDEFIFLPGVLEGLSILEKYFYKIIVVTNQRGIGRKRMTEKSLHSIHDFMLSEINKAGGRIDKIYFAPDLDDLAINRKPNPGMALQAKQDFPGIDFTKSIIAGNKLSDMRFGRNAGMHTVFIATTHPETPYPHVDIDFRYDSLYDFANAILER